MLEIHGIKVVLRSVVELHGSIMGVIVEIRYSGGVRTDHIEK